MVIIFAYKGNKDSIDVRNEVVYRYNDLIESSVYVDLFYKNRVPYMNGDKEVSITHTDIGNGERIELIAIGDDKVGIDIESTTRRLKYDISSRYYTKEERDYVGNDRDRLLEVWQKKEAYGKSMRIGVYPDNVIGIDGFTSYNIYEGYRVILYSKDTDVAFIAI